jgi:hypothetical protein
MGDPIRVMIEQGRKKPVAVACAFDWPGWDRGGKQGEEEALRVLETYRPRYAKVAALAGLAEEFEALGDATVVERIVGIGMTDFYGLSMRSASAEEAQMTDAECDRKLALLQASWAYFDAVAARVSAELRKGPRGGGRDRDRIVQHVNGVEIGDFALKVGVHSPDEAWLDPDKLRGHREAFSAAIREHNAAGTAARNWTVQFLIRHSAWHMLDHAWEMEDRDLSADSN